MPKVWTYRVDPANFTRAPGHNPIKSPDDALFIFSSLEKAAAYVRVCFGEEATSGIIEREIDNPIYPAWIRIDRYVDICGPDGKL